jgi:hypothetical protein
MLGDCCCDTEEWDFRFTWRLPEGGLSESVQVLDMLNCEAVPGILGTSQPFGGIHEWLHSGVRITKQLTPLSFITLQVRQTKRGGFGTAAPVPLIIPGQGLNGYFDVLDPISGGANQFYGNPERTEEFYTVNLLNPIRETKLAVCALFSGSERERRKTFEPGIELIVHGHVKTERFG